MERSNGHSEGSNGTIDINLFKRYHGGRYKNNPGVVVINEKYCKVLPGTIIQSADKYQVAERELELENVTFDDGEGRGQTHVGTFVFFPCERV